MYRNFYSLHSKPFENTPDPDFLFLSAQHQEALSSLLYGIKEAKGFILITGSVGTGKTTLVRTFLQKAGSEHLVISIINPKTSFDEVYAQLRKKLSLDDHLDNQLEGIESLKEKLVEINSKGRRVVILVDEAHLLKDESLEEIRLLSNIEHEKEKLIQIVLIGQNEIYPLLESDRHKSLNQRIVINRQLVPLNEKETTEYIKHRLNVAGANIALFNKDSLRLIWKKSQGAPRVINQICDNALLIGYATEAKTIHKGILKEVIQDMGKRASFTQRSKFAKPNHKAILAIAASITLVIGMFLWGNKPTQAPVRTTTIPDTISPEQPQTQIEQLEIIPTKTIISQASRLNNNFPTPKKQTIKTSDLLTDIAYREYGTMSETVIDYIQRANDIKDINRIYSGQKIYLPKITVNDLIRKKDANHFYIHYASFYSDIPAELVAKRLKKEGHDVNIEESIQGINKVYRIYIGDFPDRVEAKSEINNLDLKYLSFFKKNLHSIAFN